jgi:sulfonate transport system substrate-binding protein
VAVASATAAKAQTSDSIRIGYQKSSTLTAILKTNGELEKALAPLGVRVSWHEFSSGFPLLEAINTGNVDFGADVADTVPLFAQAAGQSSLISPRKPHRLGRRPFWSAQSRRSRRWPT